MKLILVPAWLEDALVSRGEGLKDLLEPEKLASILSLDDVAFYFELNERYAERWLPDSMVESFSTGFHAVNYDRLNKSLSDEAQSKFCDLMMGHGIGFNTSTRTTSELFGPLTEPFSPAEVGYQCVFLTYDTIALRPQRVPASANPLRSVVDELLYTLNGRLSFEELAKTPLFTQYLSYCIV